jgi:hypothetical protein
MATVTNQVQIAVTAARVVSITFILIIGTIAILEILNFFVFPNGRKASSCKITDRPRIWLFLTTVFGFWTTLIVTLMWWVDWTGNPEGCDRLTNPQLPLIYVIMKQFLYLFLFDRAKIVHDALGLNGFKVRMLRWLILLACTTGVPALVWWLFFVYWRSKVLPGVGTCVQFTESVGAIAAVASLDFCLSLAMLILFIVPLTRHAKITEEHHQSTQFKRLLNRNLSISVLLMCSTLFALIFMTVELSIVFGATPDPNLEHMQIWSTIAPEIDTFITVIASHVLTTAWIPHPLRKRLVHISSKTGPNSPAKSSPSVRIQSSPVHESRSIAASVRHSSKEL